MKQLMNLNKFLLVSLLLSSCLKTTEEINNEKNASKVKQVQTEQSQVIISNLMSKNKEVEEQIMILQGKIDDLNYKVSQQSPEALNSNSKVSTTKDEDIAQLKEKVSSLEAEMQKQREFIQKVTETLSKIQESLR